MSYEMRAMRPGDIEHVSQHMRQSDVHEVAAAVGLSPTAALSLSVALSTSVIVAAHNNVPFAIMGCAPAAEEGLGTPWLLATDDWKNHRRQIVTETPKVIAHFHSLYARLTNYVDARHADSIRWLKWAGFSLAPAKPYGLFGLPFHQFTKAV